MAKTDFLKVIGHLKCNQMSCSSPGSEKEDRIRWEMARYGIPDLYIGGGKIYYDKKFLLFDKDGSFFGYCVASTDKLERTDSFVACKLTDIGIDI